MGKNVKASDKNIVCKKNDELELEIEDLSSTGEGIGKVEGYTLFIKDALIGDKVRVKVMKTKKNYGFARLMEIIEPSKWRIIPKCSVARQCGGCQLQHCSYEKQLQWKEKKVMDCIMRIGGFTDIKSEGIIGMEYPYYYRNKAQFPVGYNKEKELIAGFYAGRTHSIISHSDCAIQNPCNKIIVETILEFMKEYDITAYDEITHKGIVRHIVTRVGYTTGEVMVTLVINGTKMPYSDKLIQKLLACNLSSENQNISAKLEITSICINKNTEKTNVILGDEIEVLYGKNYIEDYIGDIKYRISPLSFYQVNPVQTQKLYKTALEFADLKGGEIVWDLYCGIGTISLFLAQKAEKVCGVEIVPQAIEDAKVNAALNEMDNVEFFCGAAEEVVPQKYAESHGKLRADVVTLDPPRKGCDEKLLDTVVEMQPEKIVYVSCDPATLARDLRYLCDRGYELKRVKACDMFGQSFHVETVVQLVNIGVKPDYTVRLEVDVDEFYKTVGEDKRNYLDSEEYKKIKAKNKDK